MQRKYPIVAREQRGEKLPVQGPKSLEPFFNPKVVAVVGVSKTPTKIGSIIFGNFLRPGFTGNVYPVNPKHERVLGKKCYTSVNEIHESVDLAVIAVPAQAAIQAVKDCVEKGVKGVIIISGGFKETGHGGAEREEELKEIVAESNIRIIGPNCLGIYNPSSMVDTFFLPEEKAGRPKIGSISFVSQSGAFALSTIDWMAYQGVGISKCISYGNGCDVNEVDLIRYLADDPATKVIVIYTEGITDGRKFMEEARNTIIKKPILVVKAGKTKKGSVAALSHTGTLAGSDKIYEVAFKQSGVIRAEDFQDLFDMAKTLSLQPPAPGNRILIVTNGGGAGVMIVDACEICSLEVPELPSHVQRKLKEQFPPHFSTKNPIDLTGDAYDLGFGIALDEAFLRYDGVDGVIICLLPQVPKLTIEVANIIADASFKSRKPIVACCMGGEFTANVTREIEKRGVPVFPTPKRAVDAMWALVKYGENLKKGDKR